MIITPAHTGGRPCDAGFELILQTCIAHTSLKGRNRPSLQNVPRDGSGKAEAQEFRAFSRDPLNRRVAQSRHVQTSVPERVAGSGKAPGTVGALTDERMAPPLLQEPTHLPGTKPRSGQDRRALLGTQTGQRVPVRDGEMRLKGKGRSLTT